MEFYERAAAIQRAGIFVNAAIREENHTRKCAATWRDKAIRGSLHDMATFIRRSDRDARSRPHRLRRRLRASLPSL